MKHIVHVSNDFEPTSGGINTHLKNLLQCLGKMDFQVTLLVPTGSTENTRGISDSCEGGAKTYKIVRSNYKETNFKPLKLIRLTNATQAGLEWIHENIGEIDLIHQHDQRATRLGATSFAYQHDIPVIWTNHSADYFGRRGFFTRWIAKVQNQTPDGMIAVHQSMADLIRDSEFSDISVRYIPNGVNANHFTSRDRPHNGQTVVFFPQRMIPMKGPETIAEAAYRILHNYQNQDISFWFVGTETDSNRDEGSIQKVRQILSDFMETDAVRFLGNPSYEEMPWYYNQADIVVLPLQTETENIAVFEAWASGIPLITTYQVEKNGYVRDQVNCLIVPDREPTELAVAIIRLAIDAELRETLAKNGRAMVEDRFTWAHAAEKTARFYSEILKSHKLTNEEVSVS